MSLKILHISDIHFKDYKNYNYLDLDTEIQREIEFDLAALKEQYGKIDIVLIGGDIAFSGKEEEYNTADKWIKKVCEITECQVENVLAVPGNHDVERGKLGPMLKTVHRDLKGQTSRVNIDTQLTNIILHSDSAKQLLQPLENYNAFAQKYGSIPAESNVLYWEKDFSLDNNILRIRGLNSALISDDLDDERTSRLVLGSSQTRFLREKGVIHLVMCHHPPQWLVDGEDAFREMKAKARILLFGHKHSFSGDNYNNNCLVLAAGAMQPSRREQGWEPRYNILDLSISTEAPTPSLRVQLYKRIWNKTSNKFIADRNEQGDAYEIYDLSLTTEERSMPTLASVKKVDEINDVPMTEAVIDPNAPNPKRKLAYLFLGLPYHSKLRIAVSLNLIDDSDKDLDEVQKTQTYFKRATERDQLDQLWEEVNKVIGGTINNPFSK